MDEVLRLWIKDANDKRKLKLFLRFVTGTNLLLVPAIEEAFTRLSDLQRRPRATLVLEELTAFVTELESILNNDESFKYSMNFNRRV